MEIRKSNVTHPQRRQFEVLVRSNLKGRSDGVSRVSNAYGPMAQGGPPKEKIHTRYYKIIAKSRKNANFGSFAYGPTRPSLRLCKLHKSSIGLGVKNSKRGNSSRFLKQGWPTQIGFGPKLEIFFKTIDFLSRMKKNFGLRFSHPCSKIWKTQIKNYVMFGNFIKLFRAGARVSDGGFNFYLNQKSGAQIRNI
jgi:hypothetical protein